MPPICASELVGTMWGDIRTSDNYPAGNCNGYARCGDWLEQGSGDDAWRFRRRFLRGSGGEYGDVSVTVIWTLPSGERHEYTAVTTVVAAG